MNQFRKLYIVKFYNTKIHFENNISTSLLFYIFNLKKLFEVKHLELIPSSHDLDLNSDLPHSELLECPIISLLVILCSCQKFIKFSAIHRYCLSVLLIRACLQR